MKLEVNINKKFAIPLFASILVLAAAINVFAFGTNNPSSFGHSAGELAPPSPCSANQVLTWTGSAWTCSTPSSATPGIDAYSCGIIYQNYGSPGNFIYATIGVPPVCQGGKECLLMVFINSQAVPAFASYRQIPALAFSGGGVTPGTHWILNGGQSAGVNGDSSSSELISINAPPFGNPISILDDFGGENSAASWTVAYNGAGNTDYKLYACII